MRTVYKLSPLVIFIVFLSSWLSFAMYQSQRGLDLTDEGLYLFSADNSNVLASFNSPFGTITQLVFTLAGQEIWIFRFLGVIILTLGGWILGFSINCFMKLKPNNTTQNFWFACLVGICSIIPYYGFGLWTPSYNWLNYLAILLGISGTVLWNLGDLNCSLVNRFGGNLLISISLILGLFAKPTTVVAVLFMMTVAARYFRTNLKTILKLLIETSVTTATLLTLLFIHIENPQVIFLKLIRGYEVLKILNPLYEFPNAAFNVPKSLMAVSKDNWLTFILIFLIFFFVILNNSIKLHNVSQSELFILSRSLKADNLALILILSMIMILLSGLWNGTSTHYVNQSRAGLSIFLVSFLVLICYLWIGNTTSTFLQDNLFLPSLLLIGAAAYGFGSGNGFAQQLSGASGLAFPCAMLTLSSLTQNRIYEVSLVLILVASVFSSSINSSRDPYRRLPSALQNTKIEISGRGQIYVDKLTALNYLERRRDIKSAHWINGSPMLDYSSFSATVVYMLHGQPPTTILATVNSYPTATKLAKWVLLQEMRAGRGDYWKCSWLLTDSMKSKNSLFNRRNVVDPRVVKVLGKNFPDDYTLVSRVSGLDIWSPKQWNICKLFILGRK